MTPTTTLTIIAITLATTSIDNYTNIIIANTTTTTGGMIRRLQFIHDIPDCGGIPIPTTTTNKYYAGGQISTAINKASSSSSSSKHEFRFYVGCCLWEEAGLQTEIDKGYWFPVKANVNIFNDGNDLWKKLVRPLDLSLSDSVALSSSSSSSKTVVESLDI